MKLIIYLKKYITVIIQENIKYIGLIVNIKHNQAKGIKLFLIK